MSRGTLSREINAAGGAALDSGWCDSSYSGSSPTVLKYLTVAFTANGAETFTIQWSNTNNAAPTANEEFVADTVILGGAGTDEEIYILGCRFFRITSAGAVTARTVRFSIA